MIVINIISFVPIAVEASGGFNSNSVFVSLEKSRDLAIRSPLSCNNLYIILYYMKCLLNTTMVGP